MRLKKITLVITFFMMLAGGLSFSFIAGGSAWANPLEGYNIHVTAPHMMDGEIIGPFHHFCKPINKDIIQCVLFESDDPNARMTEVEYMVSKKLTHSVIPKWSHMKNWHDHKQEIETGRVAVIAPTDPAVVKGLVEHVAKTDGIIFHLWPKGAPFPDGSVTIAQSVGHWEALHGGVSETPAPVAAAPSKGIHKLTAEDYKRLGIREMYERR